MTAIIDLSRPCDTIGCLNIVEYVRYGRGEEGARYLCSECFANLQVVHSDLSAEFKPVAEPLPVAAARSSARHAVP